MLKELDKNAPAPAAYREGFGHVPAHEVIKNPSPWPPLPRDPAHLLPLLHELCKDGDFKPSMYSYHANFHFKGVLCQTYPQHFTAGPYTIPGSSAKAWRDLIKDARAVLPETFGHVVIYANALDGDGRQKTACLGYYRLDGSYTGQAIIQPPPGPQRIETE